MSAAVDVSALKFPGKRIEAVVVVNDGLGKRL